MKTFFLTIFLLSASLLCANGIDLSNIKDNMRIIGKKSSQNLVTLAYVNWLDNVGEGDSMGRRRQYVILQNAFDQIWDVTIGISIDLTDKRTDEQKKIDSKKLGNEIKYQLIRKYEEEGNKKYADHYRKLMEESKK